MLIRNYVQGIDNTISDFDTNAVIFYEDGFTLLAKASANGIYMIGYAAEMVLKSAYFYLDGYAPTQRVDLNRARHDAHNMGVTTAWESYHSIAFWTDLLVAKRASLGLTNSAIERELQTRMARLHENWLVEMRYCSLQGVTGSDMEQVFDDVSWLLERKDALRR